MRATRPLLARLLVVLAAVGRPTTGCLLVATSSPGTGGGSVSRPAPDEPLAGVAREWSERKAGDDGLRHRKMPPREPVTRPEQDGPTCG